MFEESTISPDRATASNRQRAGPRATPRHFEEQVVTAAALVVGDRRRVDDRHHEERSA